MGICWGLFLNELPVQDYIMMGLDVTQYGRLKMRL